jgi:amino acid permease
MAKLHIYEGIATLVGMTIGAGILGIPYIISKAGFLTGLVSLIGIGLAILIVNLLVGEIALRTEGNHQLPGYAGYYLGKWGKRLMTLSMIIGVYGALVAYTLGEGLSLSQIFGFDPWFWSTLFFVCGAIWLFFGIKTLAASELVMNAIQFCIFIAVVAALFIVGNFKFANLTTFNASQLLIPYGVILFAYLGAAAVPEVREVIRGHWHDLKKVVIIGTLIPIVVYTLFALVVVGIMGIGTTEIATIGIGQVLGNLGIIFTNLFAVFIMTTSFIALGIALKEVYMYDYKLPKNLAWILVCAVPLILILLGVTSFIKVIGITGAIAGGIDGVLIVLMWWKAKQAGQRKPEYEINLPEIIGYLLIAMFVIGAGYVVYSII